MKPSRLLPALLLLAACEKEITVKLPETETRLVVEGSIEPGQPPFITITRTQSYFAPTDPTAFASLYVNADTVIVSDGITSRGLIRVCSGALSPEQIEAAALATGLDPVLLASINICLYSSTDPAIFGQVGRTYTLTIVAEGRTLTSTTTIPGPVPIDSLWFRLQDASGNTADDSTGFIWCRVTDPDTSGNYYRVLTRRLNKDAIFIPPFGSTASDLFFNGQPVEFLITRGRNSFTSTTNDPTAGRYVQGDTVAVKLISINRREYDFYRTYESNVATQGDLFTTPTNVLSNIDGGIGIWAGLSPVIDTVICIP